MIGGTIIKLLDGRIGTICYNGLDGVGGVWGEHDFSNVKQNYDDGWPKPEFILREKDVEALLQKPDWRGESYSHHPNLECVGRKFKIIKELRLA